MGRLYDAYVEVGPRFTGFGDIKSQGDKAGKAYGKALTDAAAKAAKANVGKLGEALAKARQGEADATGSVRVAESKLSAARGTAATAAQKVKAAEAQLADVRAKGGSAKAVSTAEAALERARNGSASTSARVVSAEEALASSQRKSSAASNTAKEATEALGRAQKKVADTAGDAGKQSGGRFSNAFGTASAKIGGGFKGALSKIGGEKEGRQVATRFGVGMNGAIGGIVSRSAGIFVAGFAAIKSAQVFGSFIKDAAESAKVSRITANAVRTTGGAAHITADQVGDLATAISNKTAIDDEQVQTAENMLLTFKNIRNETGKNNDIFNQATQAAADLSVQFGGIDGASKQLGKALNDPIKGTTALAKAGVTFTQQQKDQIATLVKSGDTLSAQKIILKEIQGQVGGAAAAAADPMERLKVVAGNLSESIGGLLLPVASKFSNFLSDTAIPGIYALGAAFQGEGVTSDGFVGVMERIGVAARVAFDFFKAEVLPRLKEFGGFIINTVVPAVATLVTNLVTSFAPAVKDVFGFFKTEVLPRLQDFASFLGDSVLPKVSELASALSKNKDFLVPFVATLLTGVVVFKAIALAVKAWAAVQAVLNVVLSANPIGLVVIAVAALVAGVIWAFKNVGWFHDALVSAWAGIQKAAQIASPLIKAAIDVVVAAFKVWWQVVGVVILPRLIGMFKVVWVTVQTMGKIIAATFNALKGPVFSVLQFLTRIFLDWVGGLITGAAKALGWVPGVGPKLKKAAAAFTVFKDQTNAALAKLKDQTITVTPTLTGPRLSAAGIKAWTAASTRGGGKIGLASGGEVHGPGTETSDSIPAMLSRNEHVLSAREVRGAGGHAAVARFRAAARSGQISGLATGGVAGATIRPSLPSARSSGLWAKEVAAHAVASVKPTAQALARQVALEVFAGGGDAGPPGSRVKYRGVTLNQRTIRMLNNAERILGAVFHITQGSYSTRVAASGGTHAGGGAMDTNGPRGWNLAVSALRRAGFASWHRTPSQGPWNHHIHSIALGDPTASPSAKNQMASFKRGGDGLGALAKGGPVLMDKGGYLPVGRSVVDNRTGKPEPLTRTDQELDLSDRSIRQLAQLLRDALTIDGRSLDTALSRSALGRGY